MELTDLFDDDYDGLIEEMRKAKDFAEFKNQLENSGDARKIYIAARRKCLEKEFNTYRAIKQNYIPHLLQFPTLKEDKDFFQMDGVQIGYEYKGTKKEGYYLYVIKNNSKGEYEHRQVKPLPFLQGFIENEMLRGVGIYFEKTVYADGGHLIIVKYNGIIGSRWLTLKEVE